MEQRLNDNDTWQPLSLATWRLLETSNQNEGRDTKRNADHADKDRKEYVEQRLADFRVFERRYGTNRS